METSKILGPGSPGNQRFGAREPQKYAILGRFSLGVDDPPCCYQAPRLGNNAMTLWRPCDVGSFGASLPPAQNRGFESNCPQHRSFRPTDGSDGHWTGLLAPKTSGRASWRPRRIQNDRSGAKDGLWTMTPWRRDGPMPLPSLAAPSVATAGLPTSQA